MSSSSEVDSIEEHAAALKLQGIVRVRRARHLFAGAVARASLVNAEATVEKCRLGFEFRLDLSAKMGMVINSDGVLAKVTEGGQAEAAGLRTGCRVIEADGVAISTLDELKATLAACRDKGRTDCSLKYSDPRMLKKALADVSRLRSHILRAEALMAATETVEPFLGSRPIAGDTGNEPVAESSDIVAGMHQEDAGASRTAECAVGGADANDLRFEDKVVEATADLSPVDVEVALNRALLDVSSIENIDTATQLKLVDASKESTTAADLSCADAGKAGKSESGAINAEAKLERPASSQDTVGASSTDAAGAPLEGSMSYEESVATTSESASSTENNGVDVDCAPESSAVDEAFAVEKTDVDAISTEEKTTLSTPTLETVNMSPTHAAEILVEESAVHVKSTSSKDESTSSDDNKESKGMDSAPVKSAVEEVPADVESAEETGAHDTPETSPNSQNINNTPSSYAASQNESIDLAEQLTTEHGVAATKVQGLRRKHVANERVGALREESKQKALQQDIAATKLQGLSRRRTASSRVQAMRTEKKARAEDNAALKIQSVSRGRSSKARVQAIRVGEEETQIQQSLIAQASEREVVEEKARNEDDAAIKMQGLARQRKARRRVKARREDASEQENAALEIQSVSRRRSSKAKVKAMRTEHEARVHSATERARAEGDAALKIQSITRSRSSKARVQGIRFEKEEARMRRSLKLQAEREAAEEKARNEDDAAIKVQGLARQRLARRRVEAQRKDAVQREASTLKIQTMSRRCASKVKVDAMRVEIKARLAAQAEREATEAAEEAARQERIAKQAIRAAKSEAKMQATCEADLVDRLDAQLFVDNTRLLELRANLEGAKRETQKQQRQQLKAQQDSSLSSSSVSLPAPLSLPPAAVRSPSSSFGLSPLTKQSPHNRYNLVQAYAEPSPNQGDAISWPTRPPSLPLLSDELPMAEVQKYYAARADSEPDASSDGNNHNVDREGGTVQWRQRTISLVDITERLDGELLEQNHVLTQAVKALQAEVVTLNAESPVSGSSVGGGSSYNLPLDNDGSLFTASEATAADSRTTRFPAIDSPKARRRADDNSNLLVGGIDSKVQPRIQPPTEIGTPWRCEGYTKPPNPAARAKDRLRELAADIQQRQQDIAQREEALNEQANEAAALEATLSDLRAEAHKIADNRHPDAGLAASRRVREIEARAAEQEKQRKQMLAALSGCRLQLQAVKQLRYIIKQKAKALKLPRRDGPGKSKSAGVPAADNSNASMAKTSPTLFGLAGERVPPEQVERRLQTAVPRAKKRNLEKLPSPPLSAGILNS